MFAPFAPPVLCRRGLPRCSALVLAPNLEDHGQADEEAVASASTIMALGDEGGTTELRAWPTSGSESDRRQPQAGDRIPRRTERGSEWTARSQSNARRLACPLAGGQRETGDVACPAASETGRAEEFARVLISFPDPCRWVLSAASGRSRLGSVGRRCRGWRWSRRRRRRSGMQ
jgi:hypothetical protein